MLALQHDYGSQLTQHIMETVTENINTTYYAQITKFYPPYADIQPLAMIDGKKQPVIEKVSFMAYPVVYKLPKKSKFSYTNLNETNETSKDYDIFVKEKTWLKPYIKYKKGDTVVVTTLKHDNASFSGKGTYNTGSTRLHAVNFALIIGKPAEKADFYKED